ncbi:type 1 glutamine amidotransferase domain-containing protein [Cellulomonas sp. ATA003]|uniref:type 1 glutamine amidotransferase domain-containing protein n=1 Tax=Cellulomonas sp. ATA003 TaxID=3073064 RepID=UPI0028731C29|nr:type 1 glutamine amidotransferase domain-containing protein [Cellulomonas sp. ATA003]WNB84536.1 type 1 glutamine amidotransferase domain-containing protein [Cellulomonas sp. ATA003]
MPRQHSLKGRRIAVLAADGFEKVELVMPLRALRRTGADVHVVSLRHGRIRGMNLHLPATRVGVDRTISETDPGEYDGLLVPGGFIGPDLLRQSAEVRAFVRAFVASGRPVVTLCHGPWVLASAGALAGRTLTSWPGIRDDVVNAGATWLDRPVVRDGNLTTSRGPQDMAAFVPAMLDAFTPSSPQPQRMIGDDGSDPQRDAPPGLAITALRASPKPSAVAVVAVVGVGVVAGVRRRSRGPAPGADLHRGSHPGTSSRASGSPDAA